MNLHQIVGPAIAVVNPRLPVSVRVSTGQSTTAADGTRTPTYATPITVLAQVQPLTWKDIQQLDGLNLQGERKAIYLYGTIDGLVRPDRKGGDLVTMPDKSVWLVAQVLEDFSLTAGWTKAAIVLQNRT